FFKSVTSSYGASDLEINIGVETELTVSLRRRCMEDSALSQKLFGRDMPPMIFQYNAVDYIIERAESGELLFTIGRQDSVVLKIHLELANSLESLTLKSDELRDIFFDGLCRLNQDFREVTKMFDKNCVTVELHQFGTGPFMGRDIRIKNKYIAT